MAKVISKGTVLKQDIASVYTTIAQMLDMALEGSASEVFKSTTLDQATAFHSYDQTGYVEPGKVTGTLYYDPALAGHQSFVDNLLAPADENYKIVYANGAATEQGPFVGASVEFGVQVNMDDGLKATFGIQIDGSPGWP